MVTGIEGSLGSIVQKGPIHRLLAYVVVVAVVSSAAKIIWLKMVTLLSKARL